MELDRDFLSILNSAQYNALRGREIVCEQVDVGGMANRAQIRPLCPIMGEFWESENSDF